ncbi:TolB family protein [Gaoshiqia sediminis]|uniref:Biopolymer transporter TolR n=1 Tax=Gaoshiqia sediminis TaxID=2986998 RepID=A0AA41Y8B0_9BACT|nr:biopolymer transporter TolR [Gaoshiqia sediminis]MCW0482773.1 biopolymer transporter TolR [Gaoshiqia sediminis]
MKPAALLLFCMLSSPAFSQQPADIFRFNRDIGSPKLAGSSAYDEVSQTYTLSGSGYNIWFERDEFHYLFNELKGDFILTANFSFVGEGVDPHRKVGWMVRASDDEQDVHCSAVLHGDGLTLMQCRPLRGAFMRDPQDQIFAPKPNYQIIQLERSGKALIMRAAHPGEPLLLIGKKEMENLPNEVLAGIFISSHNPEVVEQARIWNVRIDRPVADGYDPNTEGWLGCRLETMNVFNGVRRVIYETEDRFEAPNWMPDGKKLLFNMDGLLYKIPVEGGDLELLNTGFANRNNNDHGISFNGKLLAISHHREGMPGGGSTVYVLPLEGGEPQLVTKETPSYWHGWAPNNKEVVYVAQREGSPVYNIYRKSIDGGAEVALTDNKPGEHVDGCEYSPDGRCIYYNGSQTGAMQLWRMKPDGSGKEQLTFDEYNDWFPHISPDGKWIAFISFPPDIEFNSHPSYKRVMLRLMPTAGGAPRVIGYLYGGQGTINVPSWSPDSKQIAFVSNSGK